MSEKRVVSFHYKLTNAEGKKLDSSEGHEPMIFMEGASQIIPGLETAMASLVKGDKKRIEVPAAAAYGERVESMVVKVPREKLPAAEVKIGDRFRGGPDEHSPVFIVTQVNDKEVMLDGNHSLAGQKLIFDVEVMDIREATAEELTHGHAHGEHGHSH